ncbi:MAG: hypothetical protein KGS72_27930, partial [Cyanobacteria bacterium REEB67]|nr:hypothetical protein [Cyanobacteria bacterium REEB67]
RDGEEPRLDKADYQKLWSWIGRKERAEQYKATRAAGEKPRGLKNTGKAQEKADEKKSDREGKKKDASGEKDKAAAEKDGDKDDRFDRDLEGPWSKEKAIAELTSDEKIRSGQAVYTQFSSLDDLKAFDKKLQEGKARRLPKEEYQKLWGWIGTKESAGDDYYELKAKKQYEFDQRKVELDREKAEALEKEQERAHISYWSKSWSKERTLAEMPESDRLKVGDVEYTRFNSLSELRAAVGQSSPEGAEKPTKAQSRKMGEWIAAKEVFGEDYHERQDRNRWERMQRGRAKEWTEKVQALPPERPEQWSKEWAIERMPADEMVFSNGRIYTKFSSLDMLKGLDERIAAGDVKALPVDESLMLWNWIEEKEKRGSDYHERLARSKFDSRDISEYPSNKAPKSFSRSRSDGGDDREDGGDREGGFYSRPDRGSSVEVRRKPPRQRLYEHRGRHLQEYMHYQIAQDKIRLKNLAQRIPERREEFEQQYEELRAYELEEMEQFPKVDLDDLFGWSDKSKDRDKEKNLDREDGKGEADRSRDDLDGSDDQRQKLEMNEQDQRLQQEHISQHQDIDWINLDLYASNGLDLDNLPDDDDRELDLDRGDLPYGG